MDGIRAEVLLDELDIGEPALGMEYIIIPRTPDINGIIKSLDERFDLFAFDEMSRQAQPERILTVYSCTGEREVFSDIEAALDSRKCVRRPGVGVETDGAFGHGEDGVLCRYAIFSMQANPNSSAHHDSVPYRDHARLHRPYPMVEEVLRPEEVVQRRYFSP